MKSKIFATSPTASSRRNCIHSFAKANNDEFINWKPDKSLSGAALGILSENGHLSSVSTKKRSRIGANANRPPLRPPLIEKEPLGAAKMNPIELPN